MGPHAVTAIKLVQASATRSARSEVIDRPVLSNWDRLMEYLTASLGSGPISGLHRLGSM
jgi:DNA repair protein RadC